MSGSNAHSGTALVKTVAESAAKKLEKSCGILIISGEFCSNAAQSAAAAQAF